MTAPLYSQSQIEQWQKSLEEIALQPRTSFTKKRAVEALIDSIEKALKTRSYEEVADALKQDGLDIAPGSLKKYVSVCRRKHSPATARRKRSSPSEATSTASKAKRLVQEMKSAASQPKGKTTARAFSTATQPAGGKVTTKKTSRAPSQSTRQTASKGKTAS